MNKPPLPHDGFPWASPSLAGPDAMVALQECLPVALIATPRRDLRVCRSEETIAEVIRRNSEGFDHLPVIDTFRGERGRIVGLIELAKLAIGRPVDGLVGEHAAPLTEDNLIGADAGILTFVKSADSHPCRLVRSGADITALVSLSDLQRLPVRAALFALITQFEMTMAESIRGECCDSEEWQCRLSDGRRKKLKERVEQAKARDHYVDTLSLTEFVDKATIICKSPRFEFNKKEFDADRLAVRDLRDNLAHANVYAETREAAKSVCATVRTIEKWMERLRCCPRSTNGSVGEC